MSGMRPLFTALLYCGIAATVAGQTPAKQGDAPTFEVASVKPSKSGRFGIVFPPTGRFTATNAPLFMLILAAYDFRQPYQVIGGPDWIKSDGFDVMAVVDERVNRPVPGQQQREMLQTLLADRFKLQLHKETKELPIYQLVQMKREGGRETSPTPSTLDCVALRAELERWTKAGQSGPPPTPCGIGGGSFSPGTGEAGLNFLGMTMQQFAEALAPRVERLVVDATGLAGRFDIRLKVGESAQSNGPSWFVALEEQLGLKLEAARAAVEVLVIDHVEPPTPD